MDRVRGALVRRYVNARAPARAHPGMFMRTTSKDLQAACDRINKWHPRSDGYKYAIEWAYNRPTFLLEDSRSCTRHLAPRLPTGQLLQWIHAFEEGLDQADQDWRAKLKNKDPLVVELMAQNS